METHQQTTRLGRPPKQEARNTRECILDTALELFAAQGYVATSIRQITKAVGIKESAIYAHFESKEAVFRTLCEQMVTPPVLIQEMLGSDLAIVARRDPEAVVRQLMQRIIELWNTPRVRLFFSVMLREGKLGSEPLSTLLLPGIEQVETQLSILLHHWMEQGRLRNDFPADHLVWELLAPLANIRALYWHAQATEEQRELGYRRADLHIEYFLSRELLPNTDEAHA
jgi:AcrR family transcriptional regulator